MKKILEPTGDLLIRFTEDELTELNIKQGDKFDFKIQSDGSIKLTKYVKLEIETEHWPVELLHLLIKESCERDVSVNEIITEILEKAINEIHS